MGLAVLAGVAATVATGTQYAQAAPATALSAGYGTALAVATGVLLLAAGVSVTTLSPRPVHTREAAVHVPAGT
ncbi:hypothetical protein [Pedococcus sp. 5OH_020]|uniref:hypothetical protein n=1 Tax=Pedococcus sp. 5OH_020 TaxID=2989814 RepID=UPI0022E9F331|nr:hypothetical protein [Pedococcus sp. 5OH_020]